MIGLQNLIEESFLTFSVGLVNRVNVDRLEQRRELKRLDLTVLQATKPGSYKEQHGRKFRQRAEVRIALHWGFDLCACGYFPTGGQHLIRKAILACNPIQRMTPASFKRLCKRLVGEFALVRPSDCIEHRFE